MASVFNVVAVYRQWYRHVFWVVHLGADLGGRLGSAGMADHVRRPPAAGADDRRRSAVLIIGLSSLRTGMPMQDHLGQEHISRCQGQSKELRLIS